jgi:cyclopropane-fatty-acyl-phospholipid synthase
MSLISGSRSAPTARPFPPLGSRLFRSLVTRRLRPLTTGRVILHEDGKRVSLGVPDDEGLECNLTVLDPRFYRKLIQGGSIGAAESYMAGHWEVDDLTTLIRIMARDLQSADGFERGAARIKQLFDRVLHRLRANTRSGSRRNIHAHYDLGNEFFATFLDPTMTYSCAVFDGQQATLEQGSTLKYDLICRKLSLGHDDEVLEIGCGWGGFALHAARNYGCRVTATTISKEQYEYAARRVREAGLGDRITLLLEDYRRLPEKTDRFFDKLVSIEMIEAVGHKYLGKYFGVCERLLKPKGRMLLQSIVIADQTYESYRRSVDFTQRYIFPGGLTPSLTALCSAMTQSSDLRVADLQDITSHYATTLRKWRENFLARREEVRGLGLSESFLRMWEFYFCYCEAGFRERTIGAFQIMLARPRTPVAGPVPQA